MSEEVFEGRRLQRPPLPCREGSAGWQEVRWGRWKDYQLGCRVINTGPSVCVIHPAKLLRRLGKPLFRVCERGELAQMFSLSRQQVSARLCLLVTPQMRPRAVVPDVRYSATFFLIKPLMN